MKTTDPWDIDVRMARMQHNADTHEAWRRWREHLCEEANRGHPWMLVVDAGNALIECDNRWCGAEAEFGIDGEMYVNARIPVTVDIDAGMAPVDYGTGWEGYRDVYIEADPARIF